MTLTASRQTWLIMRLMVIFLFTASLHLSASTYSQTVTVSMKNAPLSKLFSEIKKQTGYVFFFKEGLLAQAKPVTVSFTAVPLETVLKDVLQGQQLSYSIEEKTINIFKKQEVVSAVTVEPAVPLLPPSVHGRITNEKGEAVAGVNISIKGGKVIGVTNDNGEFTLTNVPDGAVLVFSAVSIVTYETKLNGRSELALSMKTKVSELDEVQIIAYGQTSKRLNTGNVSTITSKDIEKQPVNNPLLTLQGRVPGIMISQVSGVAGGAISVQIQGQNSIANGNDPFYVIDGIPYLQQALPGLGAAILGRSASNGGPSGAPGNPLAFINSNDIENISVLKGADATAIYGSRASNGAIIITTKRGKQGVSRVDINMQSGWGKVGHFMDLLNTQQYLEMRHEEKKNDNAAILATDYDLNGVWDSTRYTDWQRTLIGGTSHYYDANASFSGGTPILQYFIGTNYHKENTVFPTDMYDEKGAVHVNLNSISQNGKFKTQLNINYLIDNNKLPNLDFATLATTLSPMAPAMYNSDGTLNWQVNSAGSNTWLSSSNPARSLVNTFSNLTTNLISNLNIEYELLRGLLLKSSFGYNNLKANQFQPSTLKAVPPESIATFQRSGQYGFGSSNAWNAEPQISYNKSFGKSQITSLAGITFEQRNNNTILLIANGFTSDAAITDINSGTAISRSSSTIYTYKYNAGFARIGYNWDNKYILNLTGRRDGSSRFGPANQFHNFGAIAAAWLFQEEPSVKKILPFLSFGKLRGSFGTSGNDQIGDYKYLQTYLNTTPSVAYQSGISLVPGGISNPYLEWEETKKLEFGFDAGIFNDRFLMGITYYRNRSSNQLLSYAVPVITGVTNVPLNFPATVQNQGWEFTASSKNITNKKVKWTTSFNLTIQRNKLVDFPNLATSTYASTLLIGQPLSYVMLIPFAGVNPATGLYQYYDIKGNITSIPNYPADLSIIKSLMPAFFGGVENAIQIGHFNVDFLFQFVKNSAVPNLVLGNSLPGNKLINQPVSVLQRWRQPGDQTNIAKYADQNANSAGYTNWAYISVSNIGYSDGSYIRLKNLSISYEVPQSISKKIRASSLSCYILAQNLFTITKYIGLDPESPGGGYAGGNNLPPLRVITLGIKTSF